MSSTTAAPSTTLPRGAGPLTTVFTTPEFCSESAWVNYDTPALSSSICMPNGFTTYWNYKYGFYSPGICPESYTAGCTFPTSYAIESNGTPFIGGPLESGESAIICCPIGYVCMSTATDEFDDYTYSKCIATTASTYILPATTATHITTTPLVYAIQVRWKSSDLNVLETNPTRSGVTITPTSTSEATSTATSSGSAATGSSTASTTPADDSGLSTGASIGLGVGIAVGVMAVGIIAFLLWRRRLKGKKGTESSMESSSPGGKGFTELQDTQVSRGSTTIPAELVSPEGTWNSTLGGSTMVSPLSPRPGTATTAGATELEVPNTRHELSGHVTDFAEMPASNQFVAELPGDMPGGPPRKWN